MSPGKTAAQKNTGHDVSLALQRFPVTHHFLVSNEKTGHTTVVCFRNQYSSDTSVFGALQYTSLSDVRCENFQSVFLSMPKNVPSYLGFHGVYNTSSYWVLIVLQSTTVWILA